MRRGKGRVDVDILICDFEMKTVVEEGINGAWS